MQIGEKRPQIPHRRYLQRPYQLLNFTMMSFQGQHVKPLATSAAAPPSLLTQVGMAGTAAVITVSFIHPIDVVKVCPNMESLVLSV